MFLVFENKIRMAMIPKVIISNPTIAINLKLAHFKGMRAMIMHTFMIEIMNAAKEIILRNDFADKNDVTTKPK